jgi:glycosyltransferase involved in cell wall biosynthesis
MSIRKATQVNCFARSVQRQVAKLRGGALPGVVRQRVQVTPPEAAKAKPRTAAIFLDNRGYKGAWMLDRLFSSSKNFELVVVGDISESKANRLRAKGLRVRSTRPSDAEKFSLLSDVEYVIFASKYEGFGIPPREAAAVGTPSLIARRAALMDIPKSLSISLGDFAHDIDLDEVSRLAAKIDRAALKAWAQTYVD